MESSDDWQHWSDADIFSIELPQTDNQPNVDCEMLHANSNKPNVDCEMLHADSNQPNMDRQVQTKRKEI